MIIFRVISLFWVTSRKHAAVPKIQLPHAVRCSSVLGPSLTPSLL